MNASELIADSFGQLASVSADVRKAALLAIARVQTIVDPEQAARTLTEGVAAIHGLSERFDQSFTYLTRLATAAIQPERLPELEAPPGYSPLRSVLSECRTMREHGHLEYLRNYLMRSEDLEHLSIEGLGSLVAETDGQEEQQWLLRRAIQAWRAQIDIVRRPWEIEHLFLHLFRDYWTVLPRPEAAEVVDEMTQRIMAKRDKGTFGKVQDLEFNSLHSLKLFQIYDLLQELRPERAEQLVKKKRELAKAVKRYPNGLKTIREEVYASLPPQESLSNRRTPASVVSSATGDDHNYALALLAGRTTQDFDQPLQSARASYMNDNGPNFRNFAPKAFWPSTAMYKTVFYHMGFVGKGGADQLLDQVPDKELRLLAQIELAAGLSKLPELVVKTQRTPG